MKNAQLLIQMEIIYTLDTDLLDAAAAAAAKPAKPTTTRGNWQWQPLVRVHCTHANVNACMPVCVGVCRCVCVCEVYVGLLISFLLGYVLCEITQVQPTVIFVEVCFVCPKGSFLLPSLFISPSISVPLVHTMYCDCCLF